MPLSKFSKCFNLTELKKGYFPHKFNTLENQDYIGKYPDELNYEPDFFSTKVKKQFQTWYQNVKNNLFNFKNEFMNIV